MPTVSKPCFCCNACCSNAPGGTLPQTIPPTTVNIDAPISEWTTFWSQTYKPNALWNQNNWWGNTVQIHNNTSCDCKVYFRFVVTDACSDTEDPNCSKGAVRISKELNAGPYAVISCMGQSKTFTVPAIYAGNYFDCCAVKAELQYRAYMPCGGPTNPPVCDEAAVRTLVQDTIEVSGMPPAPEYIQWLGQFSVTARPTCSKNQTWLADFKVELTFAPWTASLPRGVAAVARCLSVTAIPTDCAFGSPSFEAYSMDLCYPLYDSCTCGAPPPPAYGPYKTYDLKPGYTRYGNRVTRLGGGVSVARYLFATLGSEGSQYEFCCCNQYVSTWQWGWGSY